MAKTSGYNMYSEKKCPVCGKKFHPMPDHALRIGGEDSRQLVCTYSCMRKWEKEHGWLTREEIRKQKEEKRKG
jgi:hypothetical protein